MDPPRQRAHRCLRRCDETWAAGVQQRPSLGRRCAARGAHYVPQLGIHLCAGTPNLTFAVRTHSSAFRRVWFRQQWADLFHADFDVLLYDLTSTYFEGEMAHNPKAKRGYSRRFLLDTGSTTNA